jgi:hypothetical protein
MEMSIQLHGPPTLPEGKKPPVSIGGWVDPRIGLKAVEKKKLAVLGIKPEPSRP